VALIVTNDGRITNEAPESVKNKTRITKCWVTPTTTKQWFCLNLQH